MQGKQKNVGETSECRGNMKMQGKLENVGEPEECRGNIRMLGKLVNVVKSSEVVKTRMQRNQEKVETGE